MTVNRGILTIVYIREETVYASDNRGIEDNSKIIFLNSQRKHTLLPLLRTALSRRGSNEGYNICFNRKIRKIIPKLFLSLLLIWNTESNELEGKF